MLAIGEERRHLAQAERHLAEGRVRIHHQIVLIRQVRAANLNADSALVLLRLLRTSHGTVRAIAN